MQVYECGVWGKIWRGKRNLRGDQEAYLSGLVGRNRPTEDVETFSRGWIEEWVMEGTGQKIRFTRASPSRDGWKIVALGIRDISVPEFGQWKEVIEVWVQGQVNREIAIATVGGTSNHRYRWYL